MKTETIVLTVRERGYTFLGQDHQLPVTADHEWALEETKAMLAAHGLHIVTAKDKAVLDAISKTRIVLCRGKFMISARRAEDKVCAAELARREGE